MRKSRQPLIVLCALLLCTLLWAPKIWSIRLLYADAVTRTEADRWLHAVADREGWILSDLEVADVRGGGMTVLRRNHIRGIDPAECAEVSFMDGSLSPCAGR